MNASEHRFIAPPPKARRRGRMRLTERDKQLVIAVGMARHLSYAQLHRLFFHAWSPNSVKARLRELCGLGERPAQPAPLERVPYFEHDGQPASAYLLSPFGRDYALELMPMLRLSTWSGEANESLVHDLGCVDIFVNLVDATVGTAEFPDMRRLPFTWQSGRRLPFVEADYIAGTRNDRVIIPDAILEVPAQERRLLIEYETGSQPLIPRSLKKRGAALHKLQRWSAFVGREEDASRRTAYERVYPDGLSAEVHLVSAREPRAQALRDLIARAKRDKQISARVYFNALERTAFVKKLLGELGLQTRPPPSAQRSPKAVILNTAERAVAGGFYKQSVVAIHGARHAIRAHNAATGAGLPEPAYPETTAAMGALVERFGSRKK